MLVHIYKLKIAKIKEEITWVYKVILKIINNKKQYTIAIWYETLLMSVDNNV